MNIKQNSNNSNNTICVFFQNSNNTICTFTDVLIKLFAGLWLITPFNI